MKELLTHKVNAMVKLLRDIPQLVWSRILSLYEVEENDFTSLCLASADIDKRFNHDSPGIKESWIVKKVISVLTHNHYLNSDDLLNCFNSGSPELENAAAQGWRYLKNTEAGRIVEFNDSRSILRFMEYVKLQRNVWTAFIGKSFKFDSYNLETLNEHKDYVRTVTEFLQKYGKFMFYVDMKHMSWTDERERIGFLKCLFRTLPNIHHFQLFHNYSFIVLSTSFDITNKRNITSFFKVEGRIDDHSVYKTFLPQCHTLHLDFWEFQQIQLICPRNEICKNVKVLEIRAHRFNLETFQHTDFTSFVNLKQLILHGEDLRTLKLLEKFPRVRDVTLCCAVRGCGKKLFEPPFCTLAFVKKLTLVFHHIAPPSLDEIANVLPSLRHLCLRTEMTAFVLQNCLKKWRNRIHNDIVDIYNLYAMGVSLSGSNVWQHMKNLNTLVVESIAERLEWEPYPGQGMTRGCYTRRNEIYSRNKVNVRKTQETVLDYEWRFS